MAANVVDTVTSITESTAVFLLSGGAFVIGLKVLQGLIALI